MAVGDFPKKTLKDLSLNGKNVLLRADYNVPLEDGEVRDDYRLKASLPTIEYILKQKPQKLVIISHLGRPDGKDKALSLRSVANRLSQLLDHRVYFIAEDLNSDTKSLIEKLPAGSIVLLENLRFYPEEEANDPSFAKAMVEVSGAEVFIQDGFGVVHRQHASTDAITKLLPSVSGFLIEKEVRTIERLMSKPQRPLVAVIGGAKIADKIEILKRFIDMADVLAIGGAMANNFLAVQGYKIGKSLCDKADLPAAREILKLAKAASNKRGFELLLPVDVVVSTQADGRVPTRLVDLSSHSLADIEAYPKKPKTPAFTVAGDEAIFDVGPISAANFAGAIRLAKTIIWNGTLGVTETPGVAGAAPPFSHATNLVVEAMLSSPQKPFTFAGGGDTVGYIEQQKLVDDFGFVSTGGGASLELMAGKKLPGVENLVDK